jgi:hypothetical protein
MTPGPSTDNVKSPIALASMGDGSEVFIADNLWTRIAADIYGNQDQKAALLGQWWRTLCPHQLQLRQQRQAAR